MPSPTSSTSAPSTTSCNNSSRRTAGRAGLPRRWPNCPIPRPTGAVEPPAATRADSPPGLGPLIELLRVLLKQRCDDHQVAQKLLASADDLEAIAADDDAPVKALSGWRREIFGKDALALKHGKLALTVRRNRIHLVQLADGNGERR